MFNFQQESGQRVDETQAKTKYQQSNPYNYYHLTDKQRIAASR